MKDRIIKLIVTAVLVSLILPVKAQKVSAASSDMKIYAIDLGDETYGDATYLVSGGRGLLMDTGDKDPNRTLINWLKSNYQTSFDMYLSHYHDDHDYYMAEIINTFRVGTLYLPVNGYMKYGDSDYMDFHRNLMNQTINAARARGTKIVWLKKGSKFTIGNTSAEVLWGCTYNNGVYNTNYINNNSLVTRFTGGGVSFLTGGDLEAPTENKIISAGVNIKADIFKMNHHGGNTSNTQAFIEAIDPYYAWYNFHENSRTDTWASGWCSDPVTRMSLIANTLGTRYNGNIVFSASNGFVSASAQRRTKTIYEKLTYSNGSSAVKSMGFNSLIPPILRKDMFRSAESFARCTKNGTVIKYTWKNTSSGWTYRGSDGSIVKNEFIDDNGNTYYLNANGIMLTGWQKINRRWYCFASSGKMYIGWQKLGGKNYYFDPRNGVMKTGWFKADGSWHYADKTGAVQKGWKYIGGKWYYLDSNMVMKTGLLKLGSKTYLLKENGAMGVNEWVRADRKWYYANSKGLMTVGWVKYRNKWYYLKANGVMVTGIQKLSSTKTYLFDASGAMLSNAWYRSGGKWYYANSKGLMTVGWAKHNNKWYYMNKDGVMVTGIQKLSSTKTYLFDASGAMLSNAWYRSGGKWYYANSKGLMTVGWAKHNNKWYYMNKDGVMVTGVQKLSSTKIYAFDASGAMLRNAWARKDGKWYYVDDKGLAVRGWRTINGKRYYFDSDCVWKES